MAEHQSKSDKQFGVIDMEYIISAPLQAVADASKALAESTQEFIEKIEGKKLSTDSFTFERQEKLSLPLPPNVKMVKTDDGLFKVVLDVEVKGEEEDKKP